MPTMTRSNLLAVLGVLGAFSVDAALAEGTKAQRAACTPDVFRLCSAEIPDVSGIKSCLKRENANLSSACKQAMNEGPEASKVSSRE